ncbi:MAG: aldehyde dehydrogenase EutE [Candidatus Sericytochromatia bacterium]|nr:aldehyde dehydrogenase EutE [Candidatus Sericytochromatia bacterium]
MEISENKVRSIVEDVVSRVISQQGQLDNALNFSKPIPPKEIGVFDDLEQATLAAKTAYEEFKAYSVSDRNRIIESIRNNCRKHVEILARMAVDETSFGRYEDKINKNNLVIDKTPGTEDLISKSYSGDQGLVLWERGPFGVIGSITPCTNPTETIICNGIGMIAGGNSVIFCPHPLAKNVSVYCISVINEAIVNAGGPRNLMVTLRNPSIETAQSLMTHKLIKLLVVTGGPDVVKKAMTSGKKVIGAGPGNPPVVVDETANIIKAGRDIVLGASIDNNIICTAEKEVFVVASVADELKKQMCHNGAYEVKSYNLKKLEQLVLLENKGHRRHSVVNKKWVGKDAAVILKEIGIEVDSSIRLIICEVPEEHAFVWSELLMPVMAIVRVPDVDRAIALAVEAEHGFGHTASMFSQNIEKITKMSKLINTSIFVTNGPTYSGLGLGGEGYTSFTIASPTGEGLTSAKNFTRERRITMVNTMRMV